jgi:modulator of FtsH protease
MNNSPTAYHPSFEAPLASVEERNRVLRNTYWLLALSMVPTVLGAWIGVATGFSRAMSPGIGLMVFLGGAFGFMYAIEKTKESAAGVPVLLAMATLSSVIKRDLSAMGKWLFIGAILLLVAGIANFFIQSSALMMTLSVAAIGIFSAFILHDLKRVKDGLETNYISATLGVYLSIYNVFQSLLALLGLAGGRDE